MAPPPSFRVAITTPVTAPATSKDTTPIRLIATIPTAHSTITAPIAHASLVSASPAYTLTRDSTRPPAPITSRNRTSSTASPAPIDRFRNWAKLFWLTNVPEFAGFSPL